MPNFEQGTNLNQTARVQPEPGQTSHQNIQTSVVLQSKVTVLPGVKVTSDKRDSPDLQSEHINSLASSRSETESNRYKKLWIKKIEEIGELKRQISDLKEDTGDKGSELQRVRTLYNQTQQELRAQQEERMKKSKLVIENRAEGEKYKLLYGDLKEQMKLLQEERSSLIEMLQKRDEAKSEEVGSANSLYNQARNEITRLQEQIHVINTDNVKLRTALSTTELRYDDLGREFKMFKSSMEQAHEAKMLMRNSELQEARESLKAIERERDEWRAKEEQLRNDLYFLKEVNVKSHEITRVEYEQKLQELRQEHCKTLELLSSAQSHEETFSFEIKQQIEEKARLETEVKILEMANFGLEQKANSTESEAKKAQSDLLKVEEKYEILVSKNRSLELENKSSHAQIRSLKEEIKQARDERDRLQQEVEAQATSMENYQQEVEGAHQLVDQLRQENHSLGLENNQLKKNIDFLNQTLDELQAHIDEKGNYSELHRSHENLQRDQIALLEEFETLKLEHETLARKYKILKGENLDSSELALMNQLEGHKVAEEISVKHSNLMQEYSKIHDEKQELMKLLEEMRQELGSHKHMINAILKQNQITGDVIGWSGINSNPSIALNGVPLLTRKSEKKSFDAIPEKIKDAEQPCKTPTSKGSEQQAEDSQRDSHSQSESASVKALRLENARLRMQLQDANNQNLENSEPREAAYPHNLNLTDEQSQELWQSYKKIVQDESQKQSPKVLQVPNAIAAKQFKKALTFYAQQDQSFIPPDVSPSKSFSQFVDIGNGEAANV